MSKPICTMSCSNATGWDYNGHRVMCKFDEEWHHEGTECHYRDRTTSDMVDHPKHYTTGSVECIDAIESAVTGLDGVEAVLTGHIIRYVWRWKQKGGVEDLRKAEWYLKRLIQKQNGR